MSAAGVVDVSLLGPKLCSESFQTASGAFDDIGKDSSVACLGENSSRSPA